MNIDYHTTAATTSSSSSSSSPAPAASAASSSKRSASAARFQEPSSSRQRLSKEQWNELSQRVSVADRIGKHDETAGNMLLSSLAKDVTTDPAWREASSREAVIPTVAFPANASTFISYDNVTNDQADRGIFKVRIERGDVLSPALRTTERINATASGLRAAFVVATNRTFLVLVVTSKPEVTTDHIASIISDTLGEDGTVQHVSRVPSATYFEHRCTIAGPAANTLSPLLNLPHYFDAFAVRDECIISTLLPIDAATLAHDLQQQSHASSPPSVSSFSTTEKPLHTLNTAFVHRRTRQVIQTGGKSSGLVITLAKQPATNEYAAFVINELAPFVRCNHVITPPDLQFLSVRPINAQRTLFLVTPFPLPVATQTIREFQPVPNNSIQRIVFSNK
jgi:hypothetical protein